MPRGISTLVRGIARVASAIWYARGRAKELLGKNIPAMGNANQMFANAKKNSKVEAKPENLKANMLVTYKKGTSTAGQYAGHVIYIEAVDGDTVYYSEGGSLKISGILRKATKDQIMKGITNDRKLGSDIIGFIDVTKY
jgi:surface antigen